MKKCHTTVKRFNEFQLTEDVFIELLRRSCTTSSLRETSSVESIKVLWDADLCSTLPPKAFSLFFIAAFLKVSPVSSSDVDLVISDISSILDNSLTDFDNDLIPCIGLPIPDSVASINSSYQGSASGQI